MSFSDGFERVSGDPPGNGWVEDNGDWVLNDYGSDGNMEVHTNGGSTQEPNTPWGSAYVHRLIRDAPGANYRFTVVQERRSGERLFVTGRYTDRDNCYMAILDQPWAGQHLLHLGKMVGGVWTGLGSFDLNTIGGAPEGVNIGMEFNGTTIKAIWDDVDRVTVTDSSIASGPYMGIGAGPDAGGSSTGVWFDDFNGVPILLPGGWHLSRVEF